MQERSKWLAGRLKALVPPEMMDGLGMLVALCGRFMLLPLACGGLAIGLMGMKAGNDHRALVTGLVTALAALGARRYVGMLFDAVPARTHGLTATVTPLTAVLAGTLIELAGILVFALSLATAIQDSQWIALWTGLAVWAGCDAMAFHLVTGAAEAPVTPPPPAEPSLDSPPPTTAHAIPLLAAAFRATPVAFGTGVTLHTGAILLNLIQPLVGARTDLAMAWTSLHHAMGFTFLPFIAYLLVAAVQHGRPIASPEDAH